MQRFQDIQISDNLLKSQFFNYFLNGDYQMAFDLISHNSQLDSKAFVANFINEIAEVLYATEDSVDTETLGKLRELSLDFNEIINQFLNRYDYDSTATYKLYNFVIYNNEVYMYINSIPSTGNIPTNTTYWLKIGLRGEKGAGGCSQLQMKFYWQEGIAYQPFDLVITIPQGTTNTGDMWVAKVANINQYPTEDSVYWEKFVEASNGFIYSSKTQPVDRYIGQIWLEMASYIYQIDSEVAYSKIVPNNAVSADVLSMGGKSVVFNQLAKFATYTDWVRINDTTAQASRDITVETYPRFLTPDLNVVGHIYYIKAKNDTNVSMTVYLDTIKYSKSFNLSPGEEKAVLYTSSIKCSMYCVVRTNVTNVLAGSKITAIVHDLTQMFGSGNEPTIEQFEAMFPNDYYPYNEGEIVSADVDEVEVRGKNLVDPSALGNSYLNYTSGAVVEGNIHYLATTVKYPILSGQTLTLSFKSTNNSPWCSLTLYDAQGKYLSYKSVYAKTLSITAEKNGYVSFTTYSTGNAIETNTDIQLELGSVATEHTPYSINSIPIPVVIRNLSGYGWSAGSVYNEVDFENKQYIQRIGVVDLGTLAWNRALTSTGFYRIFSRSLVNIIKSTANHAKANILNALYITVSADDTYLGIDGIATDNSGAIFIHDDNYTSASAFKSAMSGVMLYYELATPIITDISDLLTFNFKNIKVEDGGTITFHQSNESYHLEIPNSIKYKIKEE